MSTRYVYATLIAFALGFALFPPRAFLVVDEERYVSQAVAFSQGRLTVPGAEIVLPPAPTRLISNFPPGTSLLQAPLVWIGGWRLGALLSVLSLIAATLITMRWLRESGLQPAFALLVPAFFGALFFGRIGMSDAPSAVVVAATAMLLWRSEGGGLTSFLAGLCAGISLLFREPLILLLAPLVLGSVLRRRVAFWPLIAGGVLGVGGRLVASELLFGSWAYVRDSGYGFSLGSLAHTLPVYAVVLGVMFPGGALLPFFYRGPRRAEMVTAVAMYFALFLFYEYDSLHENGATKGIILASRYVVPALPLLAFMAADVWPRWYARLGERWRAVVRRLAQVAAAGAVALAFLVHPLARRQEAEPVAIMRAIYANTSADVPVITNTNATLKYLSPSYGPRKLILRYATGDSTAAIVRRIGAVTVALLDRDDSEMFRRESRENAVFLSEVGKRCAVQTVYDARPAGAGARLLVANLSGCK